MNLHAKDLLGLWGFYSDITAGGGKIWDHVGLSGNRIAPNCRLQSALWPLDGAKSQAPFISSEFLVCYSLSQPHAVLFMFPLLPADWLHGLPASTGSLCPERHLVESDEARLLPRPRGLSGLLKVNPFPASFPAAALISRLVAELLPGR